MKEREETIAFEMNYCQHYEPKHGIGNDANWCNAGCNIDALRIKPSEEERARGIFGQPCLSGHLLPDATAACPKWIRRTREMGEARADRVEASLRRMTTSERGRPASRGRADPSHRLGQGHA